MSSARTRSACSGAQRTASRIKSPSSTERPAQAGKETAAVPAGEVVVLEALVKTGGEVALLVAEVGRDEDFEDDPLVAAPATVQPRQTCAFEHLFGSRLRARLQLDLLLALERRHRHRRPQHRLGRRDRDDADQVATVALEALVLRDPNLHVEIPGWRPRLAGMAGAADPHPLSVFDPGRDVDRTGPALPGATAAAADLARGLRDFAGPPADVAGDAADHLPERRSRHLSQLAGAAAALTGRDRRARLGAVAAAVLAAGDDVVGDFAPGAGGDLRQLDLHRQGDVAPGCRPATAAAEATAAEKG